MSDIHDADTNEPARDRVTIAAFRTAAGRAQIQIQRLNAQGVGDGYRLAGPKHYNLGTKTLVERDLDQGDAAEMRRMLDKVFPQAAPAVPVELAARLRELHHEVDGSPTSEGSCVEDGQDWPCATMRALYAAEGSTSA